MASISTETDKTKSTQMGKALDNNPDIGSLIEDKVEKAIKEEDKGRNITDLIYSHGERIVSGDGKRIRIWAGYNIAKAIEPEKDTEEIIDSLIPVEIIHGSSLIVDDVDDKDRKRRGLPTLHEFALNGIDEIEDELEKEVVESLKEEIPEDFHDGLVSDENRANSLAINYAFSARDKAYDWIFKEGNKINNGKREDLRRVLRQEEKKLPKGQICDLKTEELLEGEKSKQLLSKDDSYNFEEVYEEIIENKTSPLFIAPAYIVENITDAENETISKIVEALEHTAKAFQIRDDVIDISQGEIGKDRYSDIEEGTLNLPLYKSLEYLKDDPEDQDIEEYLENTEDIEEILGDYESASEFLEDVIRSKKPSETKVRIAGDAFQATPAIDETNQLAEDYAEKAEEIYNSLELEEEYLESLNTINWLAATRSK